MKILFPSILLIMQFMVLPAQNMRELNREGVKAYKDSSWSQAELSFRKALEADSSSVEAVYNIANTLYKQGKYEEAGKLFEELSASLDEKNYLSKINHNLGNSFIKKERYEQSIEAYKNALRLSPDDDETRYNLAYAKAKLKQQQQQEQEQQDKDQDQEKQDKEEKQKDNKDQQDQQQEQEKQEQQQQNQDQEEKENKQEQQETQTMESLSKEDMERLLKAIQQQEKEVQQKLEEEKARAPKTKTEKDW